MPVCEAPSLGSLVGLIPPSGGGRAEVMEARRGALEAGGGPQSGTQSLVTFSRTGHSFWARELAPYTPTGSRSCPWGRDHEQLSLSPQVTPF